ncbi:type VI secretion system protein TssA [Defluviimonas sp. WL0024]|uniref:Type VI secretion system protein TssA n=1 Tax=Albidovulum salinarum TaxID=2984153 RepID=A0ABT2XA34_9RHOB|nr:type VI secretion system protein TssA [Defluviimonas sp. WL0024]MCU9849892.1 type VI secretion system protein TssA [Defluviimonas sp. WL0024]
MPISDFLAAISDAAPSGENVEYDMSFTEMELAGQYGEETQVGDVVREAEEPDWKELVGKAEAVLRQSHDLRAAVYLAEAQLHLKGLAAFVEVTGLIRGYLEQYWDSCHPQLDEDDGDATMRINAVQGLADTSRMLRALRRAALTDSRVFGRMSLRDVEIADGKVSPPAGMETVPDSGAVSAAFQDTDDEVLAKAAAAATAALADLRAIDAVFTDKTPGEGPQLDPALDALKAIGAVYKRFGASGDAEGESADNAGEESETPSAAAEGGAPRAAAGRSGGGAISSPSDVTAALDRIIAYYGRSEPSSPVPILLERAKRLVNADFLTIIADMAKDGLEEVHRIGGIKRRDDDY